MGEFQDALKEVRSGSAYPRSIDFSRAIGIPRRTYTHYETGDQYPAEETLERIIRYAAVPNNVAIKLRELRNKGLALRAGIELVVLSVNVDVSSLAEKIQREVEYELKRAGIKMTPRSRKVCVRRINMILDDALGKR